MWKIPFVEKEVMFKKKKKLLVVLIIFSFLKPACQMIVLLALMNNF